MAKDSDGKGTTQTPKRRRNTTKKAEDKKDPRHKTVAELTLSDIESILDVGEEEELTNEEALTHWIDRWLGYRRERLKAVSNYMTSKKVHNEKDQREWGQRAVQMLRYQDATADDIVELMATDGDLKFENYVDVPTHVLEAMEKAWDEARVRLQAEGALQAEDGTMAAAELAQASDNVD